MVTSTFRLPSIEAAVHPAVRRQMAERLPPPATHDVALRPLGGGDATTMIVTSGAADMLGQLFEDLAAPDWRDRLARMRRLRTGDDGRLELNQPIHRRFQIALFEAICAHPGDPRLDPKKIASSGLVLRRLGSGGREAWIKRGRTAIGWTAVSDPLADPDPAKAPPHPANAAIRQAIAAHRAASQATPAAAAAEDVLSLHVAPPEVCAALGRTVLFAVIPVVSNEIAATPAPRIDYQGLSGQARAEMTDHFSEYLAARPARDMPRKGEVLSADWNVMAPDTATSDYALSKLGTFLYQITAEFDALGTGAGASALMTQLAQIALPTALDGKGRVTHSIDAATFVRQAAPILVGGEANPNHYTMPLSWPEMNGPTGAALTDKALGCLSDAQVTRIGPPGKFAHDDDLYLVRGFLRVAGHDACPDTLVWSTVESEPFRILPWWDGEGPGTTIALPDLGKLRKAKPSVSFLMPPAIGNLLKGNMKDLATGAAKANAADGPLTIGWLCSFSIPFITICAFIVLNIFLSLFNIIFSWLLFIKICIPIPMPKGAVKAGGS